MILSITTTQNAGWWIRGHEIYRVLYRFVEFKDVGLNTRSEEMKITGQIF